jgi:threonine/homoserine/homoserine lactone efflux protein
MDLPLFIKGVLIGFAIAAPVGPIGVLCIRRSVADGRIYGFVSGLGAATADAVYGAIAAFGLTVVSGFLVEQQAWLRLLGGLFLLWLGLRTFFAAATDEARSSRRETLWGAYGSTFVLTLTNPLTILSFAAIYSGLGLTGQGGGLEAGVMVLGVFCGSATWWFFLSLASGMFSTRVTPRSLRWINRLAGVIIVGFGMAALASLLP